MREAHWAAFSAECRCGSALVAASSGGRHQCGATAPSATATRPSSCWKLSSTSRGGAIGRELRTAWDHPGRRLHGTRVPGWLLDLQPLRSAGASRRRRQLVGSQGRPGDPPSGLAGPHQQPVILTEQRPPPLVDPVRPPMRHVPVPLGGRSPLLRSGTRPAMRSTGSRRAC